MATQAHTPTPSYQAYQILRFAIALAPVVAGLDKFFYFLTDWSQYLADPFNVFGNAVATMFAIGIIEIFIGVGVWLKPRIFSYAFAALLAGIIINLIVKGDYYDLAFQDVGLMLSTFALAKLSQEYDTL